VKSLSIHERTTATRMRYAASASKAENNDQSECFVR